MIRCFLKNEITSSFCAQVAGIPSSTKRFIRNNPSVGSCPEFLPILTKQENEEIDKALEAIKTTRMTPRNKAWVLLSTQPPMQRDNTQKEALKDKETSVDNTEQANAEKEISIAVQELDLWCDKYKHLLKREETVRKIRALIEGR